MTIFDDISNALAVLIGADAEIAGWILGFVIIIALTIAMIWVLGETAMEGMGLILPSAIGITFAVLIGWWPLWTWLGLVLIAVLVIVFQARPGGAGG